MRLDPEQRKQWAGGLYMSSKRVRIAWLRLLRALRQAVGL